MTSPGAIRIIKQAELSNGTAVVTAKRTDRYSLRPFCTFATINSSRYSQHIDHYTTEAGALHAHDELLRRLSAKPIERTFSL